MGKEFLLEIGTEEIPAGYIAPAIAQLKSVFVNAVAARKIACDGAEVYATPRRMVLYVANIAEKQSDYSEEVLGPPRKVAVDATGAYTKAATGFAASQGIDPAKLSVFVRDGKEYVGYVKKSRGEKTADILKAILPDLIFSLSFPKSMKWGNGDIRFVRPVHWVLALFGGRTLRFTFGDIPSSNKTRGHRFMANKALTVRNWAEYLQVLEQNYVVLDGAKRREIIVSAAKKIAADVGGSIETDEDLFDTLSYLVEYPVPMLGTFEDRFLNLPKEILVVTMKNHQKYIPIVDSKGRLLPCFVIVANTKDENRQIVVSGNSKVVRARFSDADYYFEKDKKVRLHSLLEQLDKVVFQVKLGSYGEKTARLVQSCDFISSMISPGMKEHVARAARLSKADLVTGMVYEFPALQGIIGGELARIQGEDALVYKAIYEHYRPQSPEDVIPETTTGIILSLADKIDNLTGFFGIGLAPKGTSDPYGLRRQAIGIIRILTEKNLPLDYTQLIRFSYETLKGKLSVPYEKVLADVTDFIGNRFYYQMEMQGFSTEVISSVVATRPVDLAAARELIRVMDGEYRKDSFRDCVLAFKRIANISKGTIAPVYTTELFRDDAERSLNGAYSEAAVQLTKAVAEREYSRIPSILTSLKPQIDAYFETVLVMDKDPSIKANRLGFLAAMKSFLDSVMDFTKIQL